MGWFKGKNNYKSYKQIFEEIPNPSTPKHPPNITSSKSSQHESPHINNDQSLEVPTNSIPNSPVQVHPLTPTNEIIQEKLHFLIVEDNSSPHFPFQIPSNPTTPINATTPHVFFSPMKINHVKSSHTLSASHFENPRNNILNSQSKLSTPSNSPTPGLRDPSNKLSHMGSSPPILHETQQNPPSSLIPPESQAPHSPNYQFYIFTDEV
ncbi:hypothetical protein O181_087950 [Austropuccinia psidii MF-1]|uniref:Uncharacterized protein n=1 Tax=Austropuccinia psidii MF-1 TaxID=1389203 RepID=A0A9Q3IQL5_9BASI|nr:hypothetical protein [Austropuccinia psidii MF-1]